MKNSYRTLKRTIILRTMEVTILTIFVGAFILVFFVDGILQDGFIDAFVRALGFLHVSEPTAIRIYQLIFQQNKLLIVVIGFFILFIAIFYLTLNGLTKYIDQIGAGVENILSDSTEPIHLIRELQPLEVHMNSIKRKLRQREEEAAESEQKKNDLLMYLAHDLKTPLTSIIAYLSILDESENMPPEERKKCTHISLEKAVRLKELMDEFFEITRFSLEDMVLEQNPVNVSMMLEQIADEAYAVLAEKGLRCEVDIHEDLTVTGDADKLARVFDNLLRNAINYSYPDTCIRISAWSQQQWVYIDFVNQGPAIPEKQLTMIFEKFIRMDSARSSETGGAGLGLAIAKQIVTAHGGEIHAENCSEGIRFEVKLPGEEL
ncbi:HAMP domain-containing sensor histidine kinase [Oscillospiraceae bacterium NTUH-002-81]|nr:HAMP domain-containing sensor histidine kinase [Oscillospiraceae bacterium NTUH-002-81]